MTVTPKYYLINLKITSTVTEQRLASGSLVPTLPLQPVA
jgi:hypothetical protein